MTTPDDEIERLVATARAADPSIEADAGAEVARGCVEELGEHPDADAAEIARRYLAKHPDADASWVAHIARALVA